MSWFDCTLIAPLTWRLAEPLGKVEPRFGVGTVNMFLVAGRDQATLIDTGMGIGPLPETVHSLCNLPLLVCNTHFHWDHTGGNSSFDKIAIHADEAALLDREPDVREISKQMNRQEVRAILPSSFDPQAYRIVPKAATRVLNDGDRIELGGRTLQVLHTPGHSPGHVCYLDAFAGLLFTGDTAIMGPMYACFKGSDPMAFGASASRLAELTGQVRLIAPGHDQLVEDSSFLSDIADAAGAVLKGTAGSTYEDDFIGGREFRFSRFSIWLPK